MENPSQLRQTLESVLAGSEQAMARLVAFYEPHIRRVIRRRMPRQMRPKFDSADFIQMVWASTFRDRQRFEKMAGHSDLVRYLTALARNKLVQEFRKRLRTQAYNVQRERSLDGDEPAGALQPAPTPSQRAMAREQLQQIMERLPDRERRIVWLRMQGATYVEIAERLQLHERTVRKIVHRLGL